MFDIDELSIISVYLHQFPTPSRQDVISAIQSGLPYMGSEMAQIASSAIAKLNLLGDTEFLKLDLSQADFE